MSLLVKICGMTDEQAVDAAVSAGADAVGFVFAESPRRITPQQARSISKDISPGVLRVAVMLHPDNDEWQEVLDVFQPDVLQTDAGRFRLSRCAGAHPPLAGDPRGRYRRHDAIAVRV